MKRAAEGAPAAEELAKRQALGEDEAAAAVEPPDDELDELGIPTGWRECPPMGTPIERFLPMKVPLGARFDKAIAPEHRFSVDAAAAMAAERIQGKAWPIVQLDEEGRPVQVQAPAVIGLVIDLTRSTRYYDAARWRELGVRHIKIPCQGRGAVPEPEKVSDLCWEMYAYLQECPNGMALIHCTHGFNRTGYMIASYLMRMQALNVPKALAAFAGCRAPGIYKHYYIRQLFRYYHERMPPGFPLPPTPAWKGGDEDEDEGEGEEGEGEEGEEGQEAQGHMEHDDAIGEEIDLPEQGNLRYKLMDAILGVDPERSRIWLPGSQPVSLDASNKSLLEQRQYWVTWKADGTRYMLILLRWGTYLVDRKFAIRRVQMRWPQPLQPGQPAKGPVGKPHHWTVLDGEMVVDEDLVEGRRTRRFLAYDCVMLNGERLADRPWMDRYRAIQSHVVEPRQVERHKIATGQWQYPYQYEKEAFSVRRKEFWPLTQASKLIHSFIPKLCHEADGLIFQGAQDAYIPGTCPELLKWKFAHMNSVDFRLRIHPRDGLQLELLETRRGDALPEGQARGYHALPGARVEFPEGEDPMLYDMRIIECSYDPEAQVWRYMRERKDKDMPNAWHVYESVARSIEDNIKEEELLAYIQQALRLPLYDKDCGRVPPTGGHHGHGHRSGGGGHHSQQQQQQQHGQQPAPHPWEAPDSAPQPQQQQQEQRGPT